MNRKGIVIGGLVATILPFILAMGLVVIGLNNRILNLIIFFIPMFMGAAIAGVLSMNKSNCWKNGVFAVALMEIIFIFMMFLMDYYLIHEPFAIILITPIFLLIGAIGGSIGGRMKS